jgi:hypothetical protein
MPHNDFVAILFCGVDADADVSRNFFDRVISHAGARAVFAGYPA